MPYADGSRSGGRKKGTPNKTTTRLKDAIMKSFEQVGGEKYLARLAEEEPKAYATLLGRVLPAELSAKVEHDGEIKISWEK